MNSVGISLSRTDRAILESYKLFMEGISHYLGDGYEIVLHSLEDYDHSVIKIINGFHTGRTEGAPITDFSLQMLQKFESQSEGSRFVSYMSRNYKGEPMHSTTIPIQGEQRIIGLLCFNFYLNTSIYDILGPMLQGMNSARSDQLSENFTDNIDDLIRSSVYTARSEVFANPTIPANNKNKEIIRILSERGIFKLKDGVVKTAVLLDISKNTVYMHLRNLDKA